MIEFPKLVEGVVGWRLPYFYAGIDYIKPKSICEIGCYRGKTSFTLCRYALQYTKELHFAGYDLFELATKETDKIEINGRQHGNYVRTKLAMDKIKRDCHPHRLKLYRYKDTNFTYELHKGFTQDTLEKRQFDFVFIDGGHSYETVKHDYEKVQGSKLIIFDDYNLPSVKQFCDAIGAIPLQQKVGNRTEEHLAYILS